MLHVLSAVQSIFGILGRQYKLLAGILIGVLLVFLGHAGIEYTSTNEFCGRCHVHPHVTVSWKKSTHFKNESGVVVHCVECHLPPGGVPYFTEKTRLGIRDAYGAVFKDTENIDWELKSSIEHAAVYTFDSSCLKCHQDLYSRGLTPKGVRAHEYYLKLREDPDKDLRCINCHIAVGHFRTEPVETMELVEEEKIEQPVYPPDSGEFVNYTEVLPGTEVSFNMIVVPGGTFTLGSPQLESYRSEDEGPAREVALNPFWMGEIEVSWREFEVFYDQTATKGRQDSPTPVIAKDIEVDAITGPTPPYGNPDQGWGKGLRPAITMTYHTAVVYCEWLSKVTGKTYRLPTEAEWEYACRAGTEEPYFFDGDPKKLTSNSWINRLFGIDDTTIKDYVWYAGNSAGKTQPPYRNKPNPWGLYNMLGNVKEFCLDWYEPDTYGSYPGSDTVSNPRGSADGTEHVIRGGSYASDPADLRSAARDRTDHDRWLLTDPQIPKSIWWYSDAKEVGFRVVREYGQPQRISDSAKEPEHMASTNNN